MREEKCLMGGSMFHLTSKERRKEVVHVYDHTYILYIIILVHVQFVLKDTVNQCSFFSTISGL